MAVPENPAGRGLLRVVAPSGVDNAVTNSESAVEITEDVAISSLAAEIRRRFDEAVRWRKANCIDDKLLSALRSYNGEYTAEKKAEIAKFGGSEIYSRVIAVKCRGATALLRDVYMGAERPWGISPTPEPVLPTNAVANIQMMVQAEAIEGAIATGRQPDFTQIMQRVQQLFDAAKNVELKKAHDEAKKAERKLDDLLTEGGFYSALSEVLADLPVFKIAVLKGPIVRKTAALKWQPAGDIAEVEDYRFYWERVSPFDVWFTPGAQRIEDSEVFERHRYTYQQVYSLMGMAGYRDDAIREALQQYQSHGLKKWSLIFDAEQASLENRESPITDTLIDCIEFHGWVTGKELKEFGVEDVTDDIKPYFVTAWLIDRFVIKVGLNPSQRKRVPYYITSFDQVPGSLYGDAIPDFLTDIEDVMNATLRSLVNNLSIASGPQVVFDMDLLAPSQNTKLHPWKEWKTTSDPLNPNRQPVFFYQPQSNAETLLTVYKEMFVMADEISAIPRFMTGSQNVGGAGRTASGLAMLINNASKTLQNVAGNVDENIVAPVLQELYDIILLTDKTGMLRGDEDIEVHGVRSIAKQEQDRVRQLEYLQLTANPVDMSIIGVQGRAALLRSVANKLGLDHERIIPENTSMPAPTGAAPNGSPGAGYNPTGTPSPDGGVSEGGPPRLETQQAINVNRRNNMA